MQSLPKAAFYCRDHRNWLFQGEEATEFLIKEHQTHWHHGLV